MPPDRLADLRQFAARLLAYREAYYDLRKSDPEAARGLPDPDSDPAAFDLTDAETRLRAIPGRR